MPGGQARAGGWWGFKGTGAGKKYGAPQRNRHRPRNQHPMDKHRNGQATPRPGPGCGAGGFTGMTAGRHQGGRTRERETATGRFPYGARRRKKKAGGRRTAADHSLGAPPMGGTSTGHTASGRGGLCQAARPRCHLAARAHCTGAPQQGRPRTAIPREGAPPRGGFLPPFMGRGLGPNGGPPPKPPLAQR